MDKETYYIKLQEAIDKVKLLKKDIRESNDKEKIQYLGLAIEAIYEEIRILMETNK